MTELLYTVVGEPEFYILPDGTEADNPSISLCLQYIWLFLI